nr:hypothetical protein [Tanacetum cinerariifolium]
MYLPRGVYENIIKYEGEVMNSPHKTLDFNKRQKTAKSSKAKAGGSGADVGTSILPGVLDVPTDESDEEISWKSGDEDNDDAVDDKSNDDASLGMNVGNEEGQDAEDDDEELYRDVNINLEGREVKMTDVHTTQKLKDTHVTLTLVNPDGQQQSSLVSSQFVSSMLNPNPDASIDSLFESTPRVDVQASTTVAPLTLTTPTLPPQTIPTISQVAVQIRSNGLQDEAQAKNEKFLNKLDENIQKIIKEQVKEQIKTSYAVAADLFELELKKILIEKIESNKSIHRSNQQRNPYKALGDAYECDKIILDTYRDLVTFKRRCDNADKDEEPSAGSNRWSKKRRKGNEPDESAPVEEPMQTTQDLEEPSHKEVETGAADDQPITEASQHPEWFQKQKKPPTPDRAWNKTPPATHGSIQPWISVESYQKKLNLTKSDTYHFDLKCKEAYTAYSNPRGFIHQNKDKQNMLMRIDKLHKFSDGTLNDVRTALDDCLKGIRMKYLPQAIWRKNDKERAAAMIQAINKQLKTWRIIRSLEKVVRGRLYEGHFRMLQRTI